MLLLMRRMLALVQVLHLGPKRPKLLGELFALSKDFANISVREEEKQELQKLIDRDGDNITH